ncbi:nuclear transport factor 2 family protein [Streptomyces sp. NBC_01476]|uniref:nuclear transport factor 2 family protein n=1 Tax=Streptomyces sp. NBC_01476 TaxID=2903881 RepID=UPI002E30BE34|nr:nuclear transport factor 2 family protein [Streptomyces sp. NBC_01476]
MTSTRVEKFAPETADAATVGGLLNRYLLALDSGVLDDAWAYGLFASDAVVSFPMSTYEGITGLAEWHRHSLAKFARTQHLNSPAVVECSGDEATLRANLVSTHVHHPGDERAALFVTGTSVTGRARRTPAGWRLTRLSFELIWSQGSPVASGS